jgi:hypothetical protein
MQTRPRPRPRVRWRKAISLRVCVSGFRTYRDSIECVLGALRTGLVPHPAHKIYISHCPFSSTHNTT